MLFLFINKAAWYHIIHKRPFTENESIKYGQTTLGIGRKIPSPWNRGTPFQLLFGTEIIVPSSLTSACLCWGGSQEFSLGHCWTCWMLDAELLDDGSSVIQQTAILRAVILSLVCYVTKIKYVLYVICWSRFIVLGLCHVNITEMA